MSIGVAFEIALGSLERNVALEVKLAGCALCESAERMQKLCAAMRANDKAQALDLRDAGLSDGALQQLVAALATGAMPALSRLDTRGNPGLGAAAATLLHGLRRLRPKVGVVLAGADSEDGGLSADTDVFACSRELLEGLTAWPTFELVEKQGANDLRCPVCNSATLKPGKITSGGNQHRCESENGCGSYFLQTIGIGDLTLIGLRRRPPG
ncbi:hypothetical protein KFE25_000456 [Diacronema lutheri]|uniref:Uncharacterized protein n=1 Tax=Diacronema lutheri TaxID=2081491 RepID=A0A8J5XXB4_DIALT|nr:hypothetical protein KFE25_000456 [Diacronema lutheri]